MEAIKPLARSTARSGADAGLGGFGGFFDLKAAGYRDPLLVAANDGVGTKLKIAIAAQHHGTLGVDLVAMCVNDLVVQGAEPLFFLDYYATGRLDVSAGTAIVEGIAEGCRQAGCALIGGETAEMPDMYPPGEYDLAGFCVGAAEKSRLLDGSRVAAGDRLVGVASSGPHSNGYSLIRRIVERANADLAAPMGGTTLGDALMAPTRIYARPALRLLERHDIGAFAHITGGGLMENIIRVVPEGLGIRLDRGSWTMPPVFDWLREEGALDEAEMLRTFNCGVGLVAIVRPGDAEAVRAALSDDGMESRVIGEVVNADGPERVRIA